MKREIRQGDPASGYLFNLAVEPLAKQITRSSVIRGITVPPGEAIRLFQHADEVIIFLDGQPGATDGAIQEIQTFSTVSGLELNIEKTKCMPIGTNTASIHPNSNDKDCVDELRILGIIFNRNNKDITTTNIEKTLPFIEKEILQ